MGKLTACCGLECDHCPTFLATQADDDAARAETVALYEKKFGFKLKPEDINCDGCLSVGGKLIGYCRTCEIRKCCLEKKITTCARCDEQPCDQLKRFHEFSPEAKASFDALLHEEDGHGNEIR